MRINAGYILQSVMGDNIVTRTEGPGTEHRTIVLLNDTAAFIFKQLEKESSKKDLVQRITDEYDVDPLIAEHDLDRVLKLFVDAGILLTTEQGE